MEGQCPPRWPQLGLVAPAGFAGARVPSAQQQRHTSASVWPGAPRSALGGESRHSRPAAQRQGPWDQAQCPSALLVLGDCGRAPAGGEGVCGCKLAGPAPHAAPSHQARGPCMRWRPWAHGSGNARRGAAVWFIKPRRSVFRWPPSCSSCPPQPGCPGLLPATTCRGVRGAVLAGGHGKGLPLAADPEGILTGACPSLGWSKTSHPSETPEDNDGWSSTEEPVNSSDAEEEGRVGPGKLVTWVLTWPTTPRCTLGGSGPWGCGRVFQVPCLPSVSSHQPGPGRTPAHSALQGSFAITSRASPPQHVRESHCPRCELAFQSSALA